MVILSKFNLPRHFVIATRLFKSERVYALMSKTTRKYPRRFVLTYSEQIFGDNIALINWLPDVDYASMEYFYNNY